MAEISLGYLILSVHLKAETGRKTDRNALINTFGNQISFLFPNFFSFSTPSSALRRVSMDESDAKSQVFEKFL